jgi:hypothetical protein
LFDAQDGFQILARGLFKVKTARLMIAWTL